MTLAERVQLSRAEEQAIAPSEARRVQCACGCGAWWYRPRREGRPNAYLNAQHRRQAKYRRTHA